MTPITDSLAEYLADQRAATEAHRLTASRAFMAGVQAAALRMPPGDARDQLLREVRMYGATVGTAVERAT